MRALRIATVAMALILTWGVLGVAGSAGAQGGLYRYVDDRGVVHFTNVPSDGRFAPVRTIRSSPPASQASYSSYTPSRNQDYDHVIESASRTHGVPPALVKAVVAAESAFNARAVSPKGAMGLMQLMPQTASSLGVEEPFHAESNVHGGTRYLRELHDRFGSWTHTLAAYNAGPTAVARYRGVPPYRETREYVKRVLSYYRRFHGDFPR